MSGHNKWSSIKHKKGAADAKRGKIFTKLQREITVAAKAGGGNPDMNAPLRTAMERARAANMPKINVENAIKKGTGELEGVSYESKMFEAYGAGGVAVLISVLTDNGNRAAAEIRNILGKKSGNMASPNSVAWQFAQKGVIEISKSVASEDKVFEAAADAGADDIKGEGDMIEVTTEPRSFEAVKAALQKAGITWESADISMVAKESVKVEGTAARQVLGLIEALEDHDDVQNVYSNFDIAAEELEKLAAEEQS
jgi:YebC/PmpR family DNA-binding regulatory protein